jgi:hypothetical protein
MIDPNLSTNFTYICQYKGKKPIYDVEMSSVSESRAIRDSFGQYWRKKSGKKMPDGLKGITIANSTTFPTRVRVRLLKELARKHSLANPELTCFVTNYYPRPELKIRSRRSPMVTLTYSKEVEKLAHHLSHEFLIELYEYAKSVLPDEEIVERFLVLSPDLLNPGLSNADASAMSMEDLSASNEPPDEEVVEEVEVEPDQDDDPPATDQQGTSSNFTEVSKKNKNRYIKEKKRSTPYSKPK